MTYFGFLGIFLILPIVVLSILNTLDSRNGKQLSEPLRGLSAIRLTWVLVIIAVVWTTPWDNYLVATNVWWYDESLVTGILIGWVPIEEYCFFVLQPILTALWTVWIGRRLSAGREPLVGSLRRSACIGAIILAALMWVPLIVGYKPMTYLSLELVWALPPIALQLGFGADLLWQQRRLVLLAIGVPTIFLSSADVLAISSGTWTIDPEQSLHSLKLGPLPIEELIFFLLTNILVVFGLVLGIMQTSLQRLPWGRPEPNPQESG